MKKTNKVPESVLSIIRTLFIIFLPSLLSPLHIAGHQLSIEDSNRQKKILKLSKKMLKIVNHFSQSDSQSNEDFKQLSNVELFYKVYNRIEELSLKELTVLRDFCYALYDKYDLRITRDWEEECENDIYDKYSEVIDKILKEKTPKK